MNLINRKTLENYPVQADFQKINIKLNLFSFTDVFDLDAQVPLGEKPKITSHDFVEFSVDVNGKPFQVAVGYLEDFVSETSEDKYTMQANGKTLIGQLMNSNFKTTLYRKSIEMGPFIKEALRGEYIETYNKLREHPGMIIDKKYNRNTFAARSEQNQMKGQIIERYAKLCCNLCFQDRLGRIVLVGSGFEMPKPKGRLISAKNRSNIHRITIRCSLSEVYSDATVFYVQAQNLADTNTTESIRHINSDKRVAGVVNRPFYEAFNVTDVADFAGTLGETAVMNKVARSAVRISNRKLNQVVISTSFPYFFDEVTKEFIPYELLQAWEIESDQNDLTDSKNPDGTNLVTMILTGIDYSGTDGELSVQLQFSEFGTLI